MVPADHLPKANGHNGFLPSTTAMTALTPRLLWAHPLALHDSAGAAGQIRTMLEALAARGMAVRAVSAPTFESPQGRAVFMRRLGSAIIPARPFSLPDDSLGTTYVPCTSGNYNLQTREEMTRFFSVFHATLNEFRPDVLMTYAGDCLSMALMAEASLRGMPVVCPVLHNRSVNCNYAMTDAVITDSPATAVFYGQHGINVQCVGTFIHREGVLATEHKPHHVTMVNPGTAKGVAVAARLALMAEKERPDLRFLWVQGWGGNVDEVLASLHSADDADHHPLATRLLPNVEMLPHTQDMRPVYASTALLLAPSLWYEDFCRVATEAMINGIPVLASQSGGLPGNVGEGGICLPVPEQTGQDWTRLPTEEELRPWFDAMCDMLASKNYPLWQEKARQAAERHNIDTSTDNLLALLEPLLARRAGSHVHFIRNSAFR